MSPPYYLESEDRFPGDVRRASRRRTRVAGPGYTDGKIRAHVDGEFESRLPVSRQDGVGPDITAGVPGGPERPPGARQSISHGRRRGDRGEQGRQPGRGFGRLRGPGSPEPLDEDLGRAARMPCDLVVEGRSSALRRRTEQNIDSAAASSPDTARRVLIREMPLDSGFREPRPCNKPPDMRNRSESAAHAVFRNNGARDAAPSSLRAVPLWKRASPSRISAAASGGRSSARALFRSSSRSIPFGRFEVMTPPPFPVLPGRRRAGDVRIPGGGPKLPWPS